MKTKLYSLIFLFLCSGTVLGSCSGNLEITSIPNLDVTGSTIHNIDFIVSTDESITNAIRNLDVSLYDENNRIVAVKSTQFSRTLRNSEVRLYFPANNELLDGRYRVRAEMRVYYENDSSTLKCGKIQFGNFFNINTGRVAYTDQLMKLDIGVEGTWSSFDIRKSNCTQGYCVNVNMTGLKPANTTLDPLITIFTPEDKTNMSIVASGCYQGSYLLKIVEDNNLKSEEILKCNQRLDNFTQRLNSELTSAQRNQANMIERFDECMRLRAEFEEYRKIYYTTVFEIAVPSIFGGMILFFAIIWVYSRSKHYDNPQEATK